GESVGSDIVGNDNALIPLVSSANIACGSHGGDSHHTKNAVRIAIENGVAIGAHPSFPDRENFGRKHMSMTPNELRDTLMPQLDYLNDIVVKSGGSVAYVKPHGALYHACAREEKTAEVLMHAVAEFDEGLSILGQTRTVIETLCLKADVRFIREAFADRRYLSNGLLQPRTIEGSVLSSENEIADQALSIATGKGITIDSNHTLQVHAESICVHGDSPQAILGLKQIRSIFAHNRVVVKSV
ncbi:UNVERIFIED_CONTAM: hypothetical protein GTU68_036298, partial [Idotea baltica]|nr:hypothetical protein [Idotea baltica]